MKKISIFGLGNFGYALLKHLEKCHKHDFHLHAFDRNPDLMSHLLKTRKHLHLHKSVKLSKVIQFEKSLKGLIKDCDYLILAVKAEAIPEVLDKIKPFIKNPITFVNTAKALTESGKTLSTVFENKLEGVDYHYAMLAGGTIARDLFKHEPLGLDIACKSPSIAKEITHLFQSDNLMVFPTTDVIGVEYASSFKNVISILAGIIQGLNFSYGAITHTISRAAYEVEILVTKELGGQKKTFQMNSQCWGNDLWMSCTGKTRNREFGNLIGKGWNVEKAHQHMLDNHKVVEGLKTIKILPKIPNIQNYPFLNFINEFINNKASLNDLHNILFSKKRK